VVLLLDWGDSTRQLVVDACPRVCLLGAGALGPWLSTDSQRPFGDAAASRRILRPISSRMPPEDAPRGVPRGGSPRMSPAPGAASTGSLEVYGLTVMYDVVSKAVLGLGRPGPNSLRRG
jgi:hypothetical protein